MAAEVSVKVNLQNNEEVLGKLKELEETLKKAKSLAVDLAKAVDALALKVEN